MTNSLKETTTVLVTAILVIASLASIGMMQNNDAAAAGNTIFKEKIRGSGASASATNDETTVDVSAFKTTSGDSEICVLMYTNDFSTDFFGCGPADNLAVDNSLSSATFSGTITGNDFGTGGMGEEKTVTVNFDLTANGKVQTGTSNDHTSTRNFNFVEHTSGKFRPASGSIDIGGDLTFSADDVSGIIRDVRSGMTVVDKV